ncbi:hypothetical protein ANANG_G00147790 [Anguilla anguilla]|uniref:Uncharacterized protein n=1 Tax=Anguilla anguilla TaxID=7936 RepID=A0A9D3MCW9_ANGAN|nr:hypothetical protein ANANG_G00147790 [Anguilla anguilla]
MASSSELLSEEQFQCSICREVFSSPVSTPCGHSFCRACIQGYWQSRGACHCPRCGKRFSGPPEIGTNTVLDEISTQIKRRRLESFEPHQPHPEEAGSDTPGGLACDVCIGRKWKAVKSCLAQLKKTEAEMQQMMQDRWRKVEEIRQCVELSRSSTQREMEDSVLVFTDITLDSNTAHPRLYLSEGGRRVRHSRSTQVEDSRVERFDSAPVVLGGRGYRSGRHYWEVQVGTRHDWGLGVAKAAVCRKGAVTLSPEAGFYVLSMKSREYRALAATPAPLGLPTRPRTVGVYLDCEAGRVSFYDTADMTSPVPGSEETPVLLGSHLKCSICFDLFRKPVTTHCGHTFCERCLENSVRYNDQVCPLCKEWLRQSSVRPNIVLCALLEDFQKAQDRGAGVISDGGVACDMCIRRKRKAVKSCLVCLTSYCQPHLELHLSAHRLRGHKLVTPASDLEERACPTHGRPLELYCRDAQRCVCALCVDDSRQVVPAETEWDRKKIEVKNTMDEMKKRVEVRKKKVEEIRQAEELSTGHIDRQKEEVQAVFGEVLARVREAEAQLLQPLMEKRREVQREAKQVTQEMEAEIFELEQKISHLDDSASHEDHILFLQSHPALPGPEERDIASVVLDTELRLGSVRGVLSAMMEQINKELEQLSSTDIERIQKFSVEVTLDPDTASPRLVLSDDGKEVWDGGVERDVPEGPGRFDLFGSVLGRPHLGSGRGYWEVQVLAPE